ncbi:hypothetical protein [Streptomyces sp. NPDC056192]|uniref:hypothetical protein n=1 Tax=unclassified Streptomyces TaxID=2593676 RepID=UPI0035DAC291
MISRIRPSSVVPGAAVNPNRALDSTTMPVKVAAFFFAFLGGAADERAAQRSLRTGDVFLAPQAPEN